MDTFNCFHGTGVHDDKFKDVINSLSELSYIFLMYWHSSKVYLIERYSMDALHEFKQVYLFINMFVI